MRTIGLWLLCLVSVAAGCAKSAPNEKSASRPPEPVGEQIPDAEPYKLSRAQGDDSATVIRVFYGTNRAATGEQDPNTFYSSERGPLQFGVCDVSIPRIHETGELEAPKWWKLEFRENPKKHVMLVGIEATDGDHFLSNLRTAISESDEKEAFIFIHGYNVTFRDAARRTAQIAYDLKFSGAPVMFSWPAQGDVEDYTVDENTAAWAESQVTQFLEATALASGARRMHIIAHSMGNRIVTRALERMVIQPSFGAVPEFNQVVLTAPDVDADIFKRDIAPRIVQTAQRVVIYASSRDRALKASKTVHGYARLGQAGEHLNALSGSPKIEVVDASDVDTTLFSLRHSYYANNETVLLDIGRVLRGLKPSDRGLAERENGSYWALMKSALANRGGNGPR